MSLRRRSLGLWVYLIYLTSFSSGLFAKDQDTVEDLAKSFDNLWIEQETYAELEMKVKTKNYDRTMKMNYWGKGANQSLVRITYPPKEKGVSTLKYDEEVYNYVPKIARTTKITDALLSQSWMGSHLSNSDLIRSHRLEADYDLSLKSKKGKGSKEVWTVEAEAKKNVATLYQKLHISFNLKSKMPIEQKAFDKKGTLLRRFTYHDVKKFQGKTVPSRFKVYPETGDQKGEFTEVFYTKIDRKAKIPDDTFSVSNLKD